jgi:hypothetical protein
MSKTYDEYAEKRNAALTVEGEIAQAVFSHAYAATNESPAPSGDAPTRTPFAQPQ